MRPERALHNSSNNLHNSHITSACCVLWDVAIYNMRRLSGVMDQVRLITVFIP
jgi:hypothetical protein